MNPVKKQNKKAGLALAAAMVALTLYWTFTYSGPYRYLAELQLKWFGVYYSEATAIVIILGLLGIGLGIKFLFRGAERPVPGTLSATGKAPEAAATAPEPWLRYFRYGALLVPFGFGGWTYYNGTHAGSLQQLTAGDFQNGKLQAHLVYAGRDPCGDKTFGLVMMGVGIVVAGLVFGLDGFRKRKRTTTKPL